MASDLKRPLEPSAGEEEQPLAKKPRIENTDGSGALHSGSTQQQPQSEAQTSQLQEQYGKVEQPQDQLQAQRDHTQSQPGQPQLQSDQNQQALQLTAGQPAQSVQTAPTEAPPVQQPGIPRELSSSPLPDVTSNGLNAADDVVLLSQWDRSQKITVFPDGLTCQGEKGYRMIRATHGVTEGEWYFEVKILEPHDIRTTWQRVGAGDISHLIKDVQAHTRIGWSAGKGDLQAPVGYDRYSFSYRDIAGTKFHESIGKPYGEPYGPGDVIGCYIWLPPILPRGKASSSAAAGSSAGNVCNGAAASSEQPAVEYAAYVPVQMPLVGSKIVFYKNGVSQGVAFMDIPRDTYYPAASLYMGARVQFNFGPNWWCPPAELLARSKQPGKLWAIPPKLRKRQQKAQ